MDNYDRDSDPAKKRLLVSQVFDAMEKNGLPQCTGDFVRYGNDGKPVMACALGQAALNLEVDAESLYDSLNDLHPALFIGDDISKWNDFTSMNVQQIARKAREDYHSYLDTVIYPSIV